MVTPRRFSALSAGLTVVNDKSIPVIHVVSIFISVHSFFLRSRPAGLERWSLFQLNQDPVQGRAVRER